MKVELMRHTFYADDICGQAAALCTGFEGDPLKALRGALKRGHESVAEHAAFTFRIEDVSRVLLAQLTRHRLASFSVQSQRYCGADAGAVINPESIAANGFVKCVPAFLQEAAELYDAMVAGGVPAEDARYILPQGITTTLMMTANARELRHFFSLRMCSRAQWEIRALACDMHRLCAEVAPVLFADAGPGCLRGHCPEGAKSCGEPFKKGGVKSEK